jgi:NADH:ubiquinone oxidoreductase subunit D
MDDLRIRINIEAMLYHRRVIRYKQQEIEESKSIIEKILQELKQAGVKTEFEKTWRNENPVEI